MASEASQIKLIAVGRRAAGMTRKEYFHHHYQVHGTLSDGSGDPETTPQKYYQTQFFDSAYGGRTDGPPNANQPWFGRDDITELWFRDMKHFGSVFGSAHVREKVGPDGLNFADLETSIPMAVAEKTIPLTTSSAVPSEDSGAFIAWYFVQGKEGGPSSETIEEEVTPRFIEALKGENEADEFIKVVVNTSRVIPSFELSKYFGGESMPHYDVGYKIFIKDADSTTAVRKAQKGFESAMKDTIDASKSMVLFGKQVLMNDQERRLKFDSARQPNFADLGSL